MARMAPRALSVGNVELFNRMTNRRWHSLAAIADSTGDLRPGWIKKTWVMLYQVEMVCLWLGLASAVIALLVAAMKRLAPGRRTGPVPFSRLAVFLLLAFIGSTRVASTEPWSWYIMAVTSVTCFPWRWFRCPRC